MDFRKKQRMKRAVFSKVTIVLLFLALVVVARATWKVYHKERDTREKLSQTTREQQNLEERRGFLERDIDRLATPSGIEEEVRETFGLGKVGERVIIVVNPDDSEGEEDDAGAGSFWELFKRFFTRP